MQWLDAEQCLSSEHAVFVCTQHLQPLYLCRKLLLPPSLAGAAVWKEQSRVQRVTSCGVGEVGTNGLLSEVGVGGSS